MRRKAVALCGLAMLLACLGARADIFNDNANARQQIAAALAEASKARKNVVLDFGANWCPDCHALHAQMSRGQLASIIYRSYIVVEVSVGQYDRNLDVARKYGVSLRHGIPVIAILDSHGKVLCATNQGQFSDAGSVSTATFVAFFRKWAPKR
ncbi:MAG: thioredoxin family protein [Terriglobia bacterium]